MNHRLVEVSTPTAPTKSTSPSTDARDSRRRYYRLTTIGREVLSAEVARLEQVLREAKSHLRALKPRRA